MWAAILSSRPVRWLAGAVLAVAGAVALVATLVDNAVENDRTERENDDYKNADDIRNRVESDLPQRVREMDGRGYRD